MLVVILIIAILAALLLPALAAAKAKGQGAKCVSNLHQLIVGWTAYTIDNRDLLAQNLSANWGGWDGNMTDLGNYAPGKSQASWILGDATNEIPGLRDNLIKQGLIYPYTGSVGLYQCPANTKPDAWGVSTYRAYSMNCWMGVTTSQEWKQNIDFNFTKITQMSVLGPANAWVLCEENQATINDGSMCEDPSQSAMSAAPDWWVDLPGHYHVNAAGIAFADGHGTIKKWSDPSILNDIPQVPLTGSIGSVTGTIPATDPDFSWFMRQTSQVIKQ